MQQCLVVFVEVCALERMSNLCEQAATRDIGLIRGQIMFFRMKQPIEFPSHGDGLLIDLRPQHQMQKSVELLKLLASDGTETIEDALKRKRNASVARGLRQFRRSM